MPRPAAVNREYLGQKFQPYLPPTLATWLKEYLNESELGVSSYFQNLVAADRYRHMREVNNDTP